VIVDARGQRPFFVFAPVQTDKTKESVAEIRRELEGIVGDRPATTDELARAKDKQTLSLPGRWETARAVASSIAEMVQFGLPEDHWTRYPDAVRGLALGQVQSAAGKVVDPDGIVWVIVGDRRQIEAGIRELKLGDVQLLDPDGGPGDSGSRVAQAAVPAK
jgi:zinc protease